MRVSPLAFGSWAAAEHVKALGDGVDLLKARGEPFDLGLHTRDGRFVEARGRAVAGQAVMHLRDVSQTRRALREMALERDRLLGLNQPFDALLDAKIGRAAGRG